MPKLRVYQLARELNRDNSEIIRELQHMGVPVTSHSNTVEDRLADQLRIKLGVFSGDDEIIAVDTPDEEVVEVAAEAPVEVHSEPVIEEPQVLEPERVHAPEQPVEVKAEPKIEPKVEPKPPAPPPPPAVVASPPPPPPLPVPPVTPG